MGRSRGACMHPEPASTRSIQIPRSRADEERKDLILAKRFWRFDGSACRHLQRTIGDTKVVWPRIAGCENARFEAMGRVAAGISRRVI
jgi:hypothetical protein